MQKPESSVIDNFQENTSVLILPSSPLLTSLKLGWNHIVLEQHNQPPWELPEISMAQHSIVVYELKETTKKEFITEGRLKAVTWEPSDTTHHNVSIVPANLPFISRWESEIFTYNIYLQPEFISHIAPEKVNPDFVEIIHDVKRSDPLIYHICYILKAELTSNITNNNFFVDSMTTVLAAHLLRHYSTRQHCLQDYNNGLSKHKINRAIEFINEHLSEDLSLEKLANELDISIYYFCRLFKQSTGISPHQYLIQQRVEKAKRLLRQFNFSIAQIAIDCGFTNESHFARYFRKFTGFSPKQFRQNLI